MFLEVRQLEVHYPGRANPAVRGASFGLRAGEIGVLIGPSGCGKTTLLRAVAGLEPVSGGDIRLGGEMVSQKGRTLAPEQRRIGMVFQDYALFPHLDVGHNVGFGIHHLPRTERARRVAEVLDLVGLGGVEGRFPHELSGGQQQRVALARALAPQPRLLLLDEPACGLNHEEMHGLGTLIRDIRDRLKVTVLLVEHHMGLVMGISDRVVALNFGKKIAEGTPAEVRRHPEVIRAYLGESDEEAKV